MARTSSEADGGQRCFLTVPGDVELDEVLEVLDVRRQPLYLVIAQTKLAKPVETEEILQRKERFSLTIDVFKRNVQRYDMYVQVNTAMQCNVYLCLMRTCIEGNNESPNVNYLATYTSVLQLRIIYNERHFHNA